MPLYVVNSSNSPITLAAGHPAPTIAAHSTQNVTGNFAANSNTDWTNLETQRVANASTLKYGWEGPVLYLTGSLTLDYSVVIPSATGAAVGLDFQNKVNTIAALRASNAHLQQTAVEVLGYYAVGDHGPSRRFYWDPANTTTDNGGSIIKPASVGGAGRWVHPITGFVDVRWFGAVADGYSGIAYAGPAPTDNLPFFNAAMKSLSEGAIGGLNPYLPGDTWFTPDGATSTAYFGRMLYIPKGVYFLSGPFNVTKQCVIKGDGAYNEGTATTLWFNTKGSPGIIIAGAQALETGVAWTATTDGFAHGTRIEDIYVRGSFTPSSDFWLPSTVYHVGDVVVAFTFLDHGYAFICTSVTGDQKSGATEPVWPNNLSIPDPQFVTDNHVTWKVIHPHGISLTELCEVRSCVVGHFAGNGISVICGATGTTPAGNLWRLYNTQMNGNGNSGFLARGNDANGGMAVGCSAIGNLGYGIRDVSFLGNAYYGCHAATNGFGSYHGNGGFYGCYAEGDQSPVSCSRWVFGSVNGSGFAITNSFNTYPTVTWSAHLTLTGPTFIKPTVQVGIDSGLCYYATSGQTGGTEPVWPVRPTMTVADGTVNWSCVGDSTPMVGIGEVGLEDGVGMTPFDIQSMNGPVGVRTFLGDKNHAGAVFGWRCDNALNHSSDVNPDTSVHQLLYSSGYWKHDYAQLGTLNSAFWITGYLTPEATGKYPSQTSAYMVLPEGYYFGTVGRKNADHPFTYVARAQTIPILGIYNIGDIIWKENPSTGDPLGWICVRAGKLGPIWAPSTFGGLGLNNHILPTVDNGHIYKDIVSAGNTGGTEPIWPTGAGSTVTDGGFTWQEDGVSALFQPFGSVGENFANVSEVQLTSTSAIDVLTYYNTVAGNRQVGIYYRVITAATNILIVVTFTDVTGAQTMTVVNVAAQAVGSYSVPVGFINASVGNIKVTATAGTANQVFVSAKLI